MMQLLQIDDRGMLILAAGAIGLVVIASIANYGSKTSAASANAAAAASASLPIISSPFADAWANVNVSQAGQSAAIVGGTSQALLGIQFPALGSYASASAVGVWT